MIQLAVFNWQGLLNKLIELGTSLGVKLLTALAVLFIGIKLVKWLIKRMKRSKGMQRMDAGVQTFLGSLLAVVLNALVVVTSLLIMGVPMASFVTVLATAGAAVALSLQGSLSNFAGGIMLLIFRPFKVGDFIEAQGYTGTVHEISVLYTVLKTPDNKIVTLPNGNLMNSAIVDYSAEETRRVDLTVSVAYGSDLTQVTDLLLKAANEHELVLREPDEPFCRFSQPAANSLDFVLRVWCKNADYWTVHFDLTERIKRDFDAAGIEVPYQQIDVHMK